MTIPTPTIHLPMQVHDFDTAEGPELVIDWDMSAVGVGPEWVLLGGSTVLSKVSNGEGGQALRILHGGSVTTGARQTGLTDKSARRVRYSVRVRSDGNAVLSFLDTATEMFRSSLSTSWEVYEFDITGLGLSFDLLNTGGSGDAIEIDYVSIKNLTNRTRDAVGSNHGVLGDGTLPGTFPRRISDKGFIFTNGPTTRIVIKDPLKATNKFCFSILLRTPADQSGGEYLAGAETTGGSNDFYSVQLTSLKEVFTRIGGVFYRTAPTGIIEDRSIVHYFFRFDNGTVDTFYSGVPMLRYTSQPSPTYNNQDLYIGERIEGANESEATLYDLKWWIDTVLTDDEVIELYHEDLRSIGGLAII